LVARRGGPIRGRKIIAEGGSRRAFGFVPIRTVGLLFYGQFAQRAAVAGVRWPFAAIAAKVAVFFARKHASGRNTSLASGDPLHPRLTSRTSAISLFDHGS